MMQRKHKPARGAFTLIELLLVLVILAVLAAVVIPKLTGRVETARRNATIAELSHLKSAIDTFEVDNGRYPTSSEGLDALVACPPAFAGMGTWNQQLDAVPIDKWGTPYHYQGSDEVGDGHFQITSAGPDKVFGNDDDLAAVQIAQ